MLGSIRILMSNGVSGSIAWAWAELVGRGSFWGSHAQSCASLQYGAISCIISDCLAKSCHISSNSVSCSSLMYSAFCKFFNFKLFNCRSTHNLYQTQHQVLSALIKTPYHPVTQTNNDAHTIVTHLNYFVMRSIYRPAASYADPNNVVGYKMAQGSSRGFM